MSLSAMLKLAPAAGLALALLAAPQALAQDKTIELKLSHWVPPTHPLQKAMEEWLSTYYDWNMLFQTEGTFRCDAWADDSVSQQQTLADLASGFRGISPYNGRRLPEKSQMFKVLKAEIEKYTVAQVYETGNEPRFADLHGRVKQATSSLEDEVEILPAHYRSEALAFVKEVREQVIDCVTPCKG